MRDTQACCIQQLEKVEEQQQEREEAAAGSCWRQGTVTAVNGGPPHPGSNNSNSGSAAAVFDPYNCSSLWQCYQVTWDDSLGSGQMLQQDAGCVEGSSSQPFVRAAAAGAASTAAAAAGDVAGGQVGTSATAAAGAHEAAAADGAAAGKQGPPAVPEPQDGPSSSMSSNKGGWYSPWELYPAGMTAAEAVAAEHTPGLEAEQVTFIPVPFVASYMLGSSSCVPAPNRTS